jgi:hypothetical protein
MHGLPAESKTIDENRPTIPPESATRLDHGVFAAANLGKNAAVKTRLKIIKRVTNWFDRTLAVSQLT